MGGVYVTYVAELTRDNKANKAGVGSIFGVTWQKFQNDL